MSKFPLILFFFSITCIPFLMFAQEDNDALFESGNRAFLEKNYEEAIGQYSSILASGLESAEVYFNLANCHYEKREWGKAILNYERALRLDPFDTQIQQNLDLANTQKKDDFEKIGNFFLAKWWKGIRQVLSSTGWSILGILLLWGALMGIISWLLSQSRTARKNGFLAGVGVWVLSVLAFSLAYSSFQIEKNSGKAIIMKNEVALRERADELSDAILSINEGTKVEIQEKINTWYKVRLQNGEVGWITAATLEKI